MYSVVNSKTGGCGVAVLIDGRPWGAMTSIVREMEETYARTTWKRILPQIGATLNTFFAPASLGTMPLIFADRFDGQAAIRVALEDLGCTVTRKRPTRFGCKVEHPSRAKFVDTILGLGRSIFDECHDVGLTSIENPFVIEGWSPAHEKQVRTMKREANRNSPKGRQDFRVETGRYFSVSDTGWTPRRTQDPRYHERIDAKLAIHSPPGVLAAYRTKEALWCRPNEALAMTFRSLQIGASALGEKRFGSLVLIADKNSNGELVKLAATPPDFSALFDYIDGPRRQLDPLGWGREDYERECAAGNETALDTPVFLNTRGGGLTYGTAADRWFRPIMKRSRLRYDGRPPTMHLGRHEKITNALEAIENMDVSDDKKEVLRAQVAEYVAWKTGPQMLPTYSVHLEVRRRAKRAVGFQSAHPGDPIGETPDRSGRMPDILRNLFEDRD